MVYFVDVILKVLLVNLLAALNFSNIFLKIKQRLEKNVKNVKSDQNKKNVKNVFYTYGLLRLLMAAKHGERKCADTVGTVMVPWSGHVSIFQR